MRFSSGRSDLRGIGGDYYRIERSDCAAGGGNAAGCEGGGAARRRAELACVCNAAGAVYAAFEWRIVGRWRARAWYPTSGPSREASNVGTDQKAEPKHHDRR